MPQSIKMSRGKVFILKGLHTLISILLPPVGAFIDFFLLRDPHAKVILKRKRNDMSAPPLGTMHFIGVIGSLVFLAAAICLSMQLHWSLSATLEFAQLACLLGRFLSTIIFGEIFVVSAVKKSTKTAKPSRAKKIPKSRMKRLQTFLGISDRVMVRPKLYWSGIVGANLAFIKSHSDGEVSIASRPVARNPHSSHPSSRCQSRQDDEFIFLRSSRVAQASHSEQPISPPPSDYADDSPVGERIFNLFGVEFATRSTRVSTSAYANFPTSDEEPKRVERVAILKSSYGGSAGEFEVKPAFPIDTPGEHQSAPVDDVVDLNTNTEAPIGPESKFKSAHKKSRGNSQIEHELVGPEDELELAFKTSEPSSIDFQSEKNDRNSIAQEDEPFLSGEEGDQASSFRVRASSFNIANSSPSNNHVSIFAHRKFRNLPTEEPERKGSNSSLSGSPDMDDPGESQFLFSRSSSGRNSTSQGEVKMHVRQEKKDYLSKYDPTNSSSCAGLKSPAPTNRQRGPSFLFSGGTSSSGASSSVLPKVDDNEDLKFPVPKPLEKQSSKKGLPDIPEVSANRELSSCPSLSPLNSISSNNNPSKPPEDDVEKSSGMGI